MVNKSWVGRGWQWVLASGVALVGVLSTGIEERILAQIVPDDTLGAEGSVVIPFNPTLNIIDGGALRDANLFHSFEQFNVDEGRGAYFFSPNADIQNILARITGGDPSDILGTLGTFGNSNPNLFLINPNGILFGENARLDVQGSFVGTTANAVQFSDRGFFSATNPEVPPLLTVNPSALLFNQFVSPVAIENRGLLGVPRGQSLLLVGGNVRLDGGILAALGGRVELGGLADAGSIGLDFSDRGLLTQFPVAETRTDISLDNRSIVFVSGNGGGDVAIYARNLDVLADSQILAGIFRGLGSVNAQAGDITLNVTDTIQVASGSFIENDVNPNATGNAGNLNITTGSLVLTDDVYLSASTFGSGNAGNIIINARDRVSVSNQSIILSRIGADAIGQGGDVSISTDSLELINGGQLSSATFGRGDAGNVVIEVREGIAIEGGIAVASGIYSTVEEDARGNGGNIEIQTDTLQMRNIAQLASSTQGMGDAGNIRIRARDITIDAKNSSFTSILSGVGFRGFGRGGNIEIDTETLQLLNSAELFAGVTGVGIGGDVRIRARAITLAGQNSSNTSGVMRGSKITGRLGFSGRITGGDADFVFGIGRAGSVDIETGSLILRDDASITVATIGRGDAGNVRIQAETIALEDGSSIFSSTFGFGNAGDIEVQTGSLRLSDGSQLLAFTEGRGTAGNIRVRATESVELTGFNPTEGTPSALFTDNDTDSPGAGGSITVTTDRFRIADGATVDARTRNQDSGGDITINANIFEALGGGQLITTSQGDGRGGTIAVNATQQLLIDGSDPNYDARVDQFGRNRIGIVEAASGLFVRSQANGGAGDIFINAPTVQISNGGRLNAETLGAGNGGDINITSDRLNIREAGIVSAQSLSGSTGQGGNVTVNTISLEMSDRAQISARSQGTGQAGGVAITADETVTLTDSDITTAAQQASGGSITIEAGDIRLFGDSDITTNVFSGADNGGNINLTADSIIAFEDSDILAFARDGRGGDITLNTPAFFGENFQPAPKNTDPATLDSNDRVDINASGAVSGVVTLPDTSFIQNSLTELPDNPIDTDNLIANSCIARSSEQEGSFLVTGGGGFLQRPGDLFASSYTTGTVRSVPSEGQESVSGTPETRPWKIGDPIVEPQGVYRLANGELVMSRECS